MNKQVIIIGAGGHAKVIADIVRQSGDRVLGFLDDAKEKGSTFFGAPVLGATDTYGDFPEALFIIAIGNNAVRERVAKKLAGARFYTAIHPAAVIAEGAVIGEGSCVMANAVAGPDAVIGKHCIVNHAATVDHDNVIGDFVHLSPAASLAGTVSVGERTHVGIGARVINNLCICADAVIGAGAAVVRDITLPGTYVGVPAKKIK